MNLRNFQYPFLFEVPVLKHMAGFAGLLKRDPRGWPADRPVCGLFLCLNPLIFCCQPQPRPFGVAHHLATQFPDEKFIFLVPITMSLERRVNALALAAQHRRFRKAHPRAYLVILANTRGEERLLRRLGVDVRYAPQNMFVDEGMYHPIPGRERRFDAIYNAQLAPFKRHELARTLPSCAYVTKMFTTWSPQLKQQHLGKFVRNLPYNHMILNDVNADDVVPMDHVQVNGAMASAHVGLCLSGLEGAMYASIEYLLAGLPVVSTHSRGGRDVFFHPDTTLIVNDDPRSVQDGVATMKARALSPDYVRATTLRLIAEERAPFNGFIDGLRGRQRAERTDPRWSFEYAHKLARFGSISEFEALVRAR